MSNIEEPIDPQVEESINPQQEPIDPQVEELISEKSAKDIFLKYKNELIDEFGRKALNSEQCNYIGKKNFGKQWGGTLPWNKVHVKSNKYYVINTSSSGHPGIHWMALVTIGKKAYFWDSYNRSVKRLLPHLIHTLMKHRYRFGVTDHPMDQIGDTSEVCGHESLAWLMTVRDIGIDQAKSV